MHAYLTPTIRFIMVFYFILTIFLLTGHPPKWCLLIYGPVGVLTSAEHIKGG